MGFVVQSPIHVLGVTLCNLMECSMIDVPVLNYLLEFAQNISLGLS